MKKIKNRKPPKPLSEKVKATRRIDKMLREIQRATAWRDEQQDNANWCLGQVAEANEDIAKAKAEIERMNTIIEASTP